MSDNSEARPKILFLIDRFRGPQAGTEGQLFHLASALTTEGVDCHLIALRPSEYLAEHGFPCPWSTLEQGNLSRPATWLAMHRLGRRMAKQGFRVAQTFFNDVSVLAPPTLAAAGIRTIISRRDMGFWYTRRYLRALRLSGRWVRACVANSQAVAELTHVREHIPSARIRVIHNGLAADAAESEGVPELAALKERGRTLVGLVANLRPIKRFEDLIDAHAVAAPGCPQLDIVLIGAGDFSSLRERAREHRLGSRVHFLGAREDVSACLRYLDIGVLCSESEGFSNALVEYMRAGMPSICTSVGGNPEAIRHGETGFLYPVGDVQALASRLQELAGDWQLRASMGRLARHDAKKRFSIEAMVQAHRQLYEEVLDTRVGGRCSGALRS